MIDLEFRKDEIIKEYGEDIYTKACSEVLEDEEGKNYGIHSNKDFAKANIKLGVILNEGVRTSTLLDLDYLFQHLKNRIPCYLDF